ncbi:MAG: M48 family metalloprotease [Blastocatellia bacterium]
MRKQTWYLAVLMCLLFASTTAKVPPKAAGGAEHPERLMVDYAEEVWHAREWLDEHHDVTRVVEILNAMREIDRAKLESAFQRSIKITFPGSRRLPDLEFAAKRKLKPFFDYYHLHGKIEVMVFSLGYPMAFNTGQIVGVSNQLITSWPEDEMVGIVAHEIGHIIAQVQERLSDAPPPDTIAYRRAEEIKADWVAMMMFGGAGLDPKRVMAGMERIVPRRQYLQAGPLHPPMAVRLALMREWLVRPQQRPRLREALLQVSLPARKEMVAQP